MNAGDPWEWYFEIPPVSRAFLTVSFATAAACALELVSPLTLYFNYALIFEKGQLWRLVTHFCFFGMFSLDFLFNMYFLVRYCRLLEENSFRGRTADFVAFLAFGMGCMTLIAPFVNIPFFGSSLTFTMVYVWGRQNESVRMSFLGLFSFNAPYLPWVLLLFSLMLGYSATVLRDLIGIAVGHVYFYFDDVFPRVAEIRRWERRYYLRWTDWFPPPADEIGIQVDAARIAHAPPGQPPEPGQEVGPENAQGMAPGMAPEIAPAEIAPAPAPTTAPAPGEATQGGRADGADRARESDSDAEADDAEAGGGAAAQGLRHRRG